MCSPGVHRRERQQKEEHRAAETERQVYLESWTPRMARVMVRLCITRHPTFETVACVSKKVNQRRRKEEGESEIS